MVMCSSHPHSVLLEHAHPGHPLARVGDADAVRLHKLGVASRFRGDAREVLDPIECCALYREQRRSPGGDPQERVPWFGLITVVSLEDHGRLRLEKPDGLFGQQKATRDPLLLRIDEGLGDNVVAGQKAARSIARTKLLAESLIDVWLDKKGVQLHL